jgi:DNA helicase-2/ATP-dependent DNA helicase PcrA
MVGADCQLSLEQQRVVDYRHGQLQVIACEGSGKTESISRRVAQLVAEGAEPASIVAFTFTERAAASACLRFSRTWPAATHHGRPVYL